MEPQQRESLGARHPYGLYGLFALALLVRLAAVAWTWSDWYVTPQDTTSQSYFTQGYNLAHGLGFIDPTPEGGTRPSTVRPPGMALIVAGLHLLFGTDVVLPAQLLGALADTVAAFFVFWLARTVWGMRQGLVALAVYALWPPLVWAAVARGPEAYMNFFVTAALVCTWKILDARPQDVWRWAALVGLILGIGSVIRSQYMLMPIPLALALWLNTRRPWLALRSMLLAQIIVVLVMLPWAYRNYRTVGSWIFTTTCTGTGAVSGLGELNNVWGIGPTDGDMETLARAHGFDQQWSVEANEFFKGYFRRAVMAHPLSYLRAIAYRIPIAIAPMQMVGYANPYKTGGLVTKTGPGEDRIDVVLHRPGYILAAYWDIILVAVLNFLGVVGCVWAFRHREDRPALFMLTLPYWYTAGVMSLIHIEPRYMIPCTFVLVLGFAWGFTHLFLSQSQSRRPHPG